MVVDTFLNQIAPNFTLPGDDGQTYTLSSLKGKPFVLYFYPKDDTSGCTKQACELRNMLGLFQSEGAKVYGISKDSLLSHQKFRTKYNLNFPLLSDEDGDVCRKYQTWKEKTMFGRSYFSIERSTFLVDSNFVIRKIWRNVKVTDHWNEVLKSLHELK